MPSIKVAATAKEDLREIWSYVAESNPEAATKLIKEITRRFTILCDNPLMGREQDELLIALRSFPVKRYIIFYRPFENGIEILRVLHGARDIESMFEIFFDSP